MNKEKVGIDNNVSRSTLSNIDEGETGKSNKLNINLDPNAAKQSSRMSIWLKEDSSAQSINQQLNTRHNTCPQLLGVSGENSRAGYIDPVPRNTQSMSLPHTTTRKSFFGELKNFLTFNKKKDEPSGYPDDQTMAGSTQVEEGLDKDDKKFVLQNRRKQVFQSQEEDKVEENIDLASVGTKVNKIQMSLKKWKIMKNTQVTRDTIAVNTHHQKILDELIEELQTEVPFPIHIVLKEEALMVTLRVHQMYKSMLGSKHKLTKEAEKHITYLQQAMYTSENC